MNRLVKGFFLFSINRSIPILLGAAFSSLAISGILFKSYLETLGLSELTTSDWLCFDYYLYFFQGIRHYVPCPNSRFDIPIEWLMPYIATCALIAYRIKSNSDGHFVQVIVRGRSLEKWWLSECAMVWAIITAFFLVCLLSGILFSFFSGAKGFGISDYTLSHIIGSTSNAALNYPELFSWALLQYVSMLAIGIAQILLSLVFSSMIGYISVLLYLVLSSFFENIFLIGDCPMLLRSHLADANALSNVSYLLLFSGIILFMVIIGLALAAKKEIVKDD